MQKKKLIISMILSANLICGMVALPIEANAANTESMYVVERISAKGSLVGTSSYTYDKNGLVQQIIPNNAPTDTFTYEKGLLTKISDGYSDTVMRYDSKKRMKSRSADSGKATIRYTYNSDNLVSKSVSKTNYTGYVNKSTAKYSYDDNGNVTKRISGEGTAQVVTAYTYDKKGNFTGSKCETENYKLSYTCKNSYDSKGRLVKRVVKDSYKQKKAPSGVAAGRSSTNYSEKITYRQIKVPKSKVAAVKEQQYALLNNESPKVTAWYR